MCFLRLNVSKHPQKSDGVLVFDEVKVVCQLMWNSRSQALTGLAMTSKCALFIEERGD